MRRLTHKCDRAGATAQARHLHHGQALQCGAVERHGTGRHQLAGHEGRAGPQGASGEGWITELDDDALAELIALGQDALAEAEEGKAAGAAKVVELEGAPVE